MKSLTRWRILALLVVFPWPLFAQVVGPVVITTTSSSGPSGCAPISADGYSTIGIYVSGTWTGTLQPEATIGPSQAPFNVQVTPSTSTTPQSTITANGAYTVTVAGYTTFLLCGPTSTGSATIFLNPSRNSASSRGGGGGGGGGGAAWGSITGTLSSQTDLQNALNLKANLNSPAFTTPNIDAATGKSAFFTNGNSTLSLDASNNNVVLAVYGAPSALAGFGQVFANGTSGSPTATTLGQGIGVWSSGGYDGTAFFPSFKITVNAAENWAAGANGTCFGFGSTGIGSTGAPPTRVFVDGNGNSWFGAPTPVNCVATTPSTAAEIDANGNIFGPGGVAALTASSTNTLTHKTFDTAGTGNVFQVNGNTINPNIVSAEGLLFTPVAGNTDTVACPNNTTANFATTKTIPANYLTTNKALRVFLGFVITSSGASPNFGINLNIGGTNVYTSGRATIPNSQTNQPLGATFYIQGSAAAGASAAVYTHLSQTIGQNSTAFAPLSTGNNSNVAQPVNLATNGTLVIQPQLFCSVNTAGNSMTLQQVIIEGLN